MTMKQLVRKLVKYHFEFSFEYDQDGEYYLCIILGNIEHIIHYQDTRKIALLWDEIKTYWLY